MPHHFITSLLLLLTLACGCTSVPTNPLTLSAKKAKSPARMVDVWNTYAQTDADGGPPLRGLAGRIVFYPETPAKSKKPPLSIRVDGTVTVFVFDGLEEDPQHAKPLKQFVFKHETLPFHYASKDPIGHGYDFFLPIDEYSGAEKTLSVIVRFDDRTQQGRLVVTQPVTTILQGTGGGAPLQASVPARNDILPSNFTQAAHREETVRDRRTSETTSLSSSRLVGTIPLSHRDAQRLGDGETLASGDYAVTSATPSIVEATRTGKQNAATLVYEELAAMQRESRADAYSPVNSHDIPMPPYPQAWAPTATLPFAGQYHVAATPAIQAGAVPNSSGFVGVGSAGGLQYSAATATPPPPTSPNALPQIPASFAPSSGQVPPDIHYREYR